MLVVMLMWFVTLDITHDTKTYFSCSSCAYLSFTHLVFCVADTDCDTDVVCDIGVVLWFVLLTVFCSVVFLILVLIYHSRFVEICN